MFASTAFPSPPHHAHLEQRAGGNCHQHIHRIFVPVSFTVEVHRVIFSDPILLHFPGPLLPNFWAIWSVGFANLDHEV